MEANLSSRSISGSCLQMCRSRVNKETEMEMEMLLMSLGSKVEMITIAAAVVVAG